MGYTHQWEMSADPRLANEFLKFIGDVAAIVRQAIAQGIQLTIEGEIVDPDRWEWESLMHQNRRIFLNGVGEEEHEDFLLEFNGKDFCKTRQKPYDRVVVAILIALYNRFGNDIEIDSDGNLEDWELGRKLYVDTFSVFPVMPID